MIVVSLQVMDRTYFCKRYKLTQAIILYLSHLPSLPVHSPVTATLIWEKRPQNVWLLTLYFHCVWKYHSVCTLQMIALPLRLLAEEQRAKCRAFKQLLVINFWWKIPARLSFVGVKWVLPSRYCYLLEPWSQLFQLRLETPDPSTEQGTLECWLIISGCGCHGCRRLFDIDMQSHLFHSL